MTTPIANFAQVRLCLSGPPAADDDGDTTKFCDVVFKLFPLLPAGRLLGLPGPREGRAQRLARLAAPAYAYARDHRGHTGPSRGGPARGGRTLATVSP